MIRLHDTSTVGARRCGDHRSPTRRYTRHRTCAEDGCETVLSVYNPDDRCALHAEPDYRACQLVVLRHLEPQLPARNAS